MKNKDKTLKPGNQTTEYKNTNTVMIIGAALIASDKLSILSISPAEMQDFAETLRSHVSEYLGAAMVFGSALSYRIERVFLKYQAIKSRLKGTVEEDDEEVLDE